MIVRVEWDESCDFCGRSAETLGQRSAWQDWHGEIKCPSCRAEDSAREAGWTEPEVWG